jgi:5-methylcytosine-specific restriction protein A
VAKAGPIPAWARALVRSRCQGRCERCGSPAPHGHVHHRRTRSVRDLHTHSPENLLLLCGECHTWAHAYPVNARLTGFIVSTSVADPATIPVHTPWGPRLHHPDGSIATLTN